MGSADLAVAVVIQHHEHRPEATKATEAESRQGDAKPTPASTLPKSGEIHTTARSRDTEVCRDKAYMDRSQLKCSKQETDCEVMKKVRATPSKKESYVQG